MAGPLLQIRHSYPVPNWNHWSKSVRGTTSHSKGEDCQALTHSTWTTENEAQLLVGLFGYLHSHSPHVWFWMASITSITIRLLQRPFFSVGPQPRGHTWGPPPGLSGYPSLGALWSILRLSGWTSCSQKEFCAQGGRLCFHKGHDAPLTGSQGHQIYCNT